MSPCSELLHLSRLRIECQEVSSSVSRWRFFADRQVTDSRRSFVISFFFSFCISVKCSSPATLLAELRKKIDTPFCLIRGSIRRSENLFVRDLTREIPREHFSFFRVPSVIFRGVHRHRGRTICIRYTLNAMYRVAHNCKSGAVAASRQCRRRNTNDEHYSKRIGIRISVQALSVTCPQ